MAAPKPNAPSLSSLAGNSVSSRKRRDLPTFTVAARPKTENVVLRETKDTFPGLIEQLDKLKKDEELFFDVAEKDFDYLRSRLRTWLRKNNISELVYVGKAADGLVLGRKDLQE